MKKLWMLILTLCMAISFTACSGVQKELLDAMNKTSSWEAIEITQTGSVTVEAMGEKMTMNMDSAGYTNSKDLTGYVTTKISDPTGMMQLPEMKMYIDGGKTYINKEYFEQTYTLSGMPIPKKLQAIDAEYIGIADMNNIMGDLANMMPTADMNAKTYEFYEKISKEMDLDFPVEKDGNSYLIELDGKALGEMLTKFMDVKKAPKYLEIIKDTLGVDLTAFVGEIEEVDAAKMQANIELMKPMLANSNVKLQYTITDKELKQEMQMKFTLGEGMNMSMDLVSSSTKVAPKAVAIPEKKIDLSMEEYMGIMTPNAVTIDLTNGIMSDMNQNTVSVQVVTEGKETHVPFKTVVNALGYNVNYNEKTKSISLVKDGKDVAVKVLVKGNTSYISLTELKAQGFNVTEAETVVVILD